MATIFTRGNSEKVPEPNHNVSRWFRINRASPSSPLTAIFTFIDLQGKAVAPPRALPPLPAGASPARRYRGLTFSPNGRRLAYACGDVLQVLEAESFTLLFEEVSRLPQCGWLG